jgi:PAS domain S-box-containing protein
MDNYPRKGGQTVPDSVWAAALRAAASVARRAASSEAEILAAVVEELRRLNLRGSVSLLCADGQMQLSGRALSSSLEHTFERLAGIPIPGFRFDPMKIDMYRQAIESGHAVYADRRSDLVRQMIPDGVRHIVPRVLHLLGEQPIIVAPLVLTDETIGAISVTASWLRPTDGEMVSALADHVAIALGHVRARRDIELSLWRERLRSQIVETLVSSLNLPRALDRALALASEAVHADAAALALFEPESDSLRYAHILGLPEEMRSRVQPRGVGLVWQVMDRQEPLLVENYASRADAMPEWAKSGLQAVMGIPLRLGEEPIGVLGLYRLHPGEGFHADDVDLATGIGRLLAIILKNAALFSEANRRAEESRTLIYTAHAISGSLDLQTVLHTIAEEVKSLLKSDGSRIHLYDAEANALRAVVALHPDSDAVLGMKLAPGQGITGLVFSTSAPLIVNSPSDHPQAVHVPGTPEDEPEIMALVPLNIRHKTIGVMTVLRFSEEVPYTPADMRLLEAFATHAAIAIENADLFGQIAQHAHRLEEEVAARTRDLALSEARYRALVETSLAGILLSDPEGRLLYANQAFFALTERSPAELLGISLEDTAGLVAPEQRQQVVSLFTEIQAGTRPGGEVVEIDLMRPGGRRLPVLMAAGIISDQDGAFQGATAVLFDISNRKVLEAELRAERDRLHTILTNIGDAVIVTDQDGIIEYVNPAWERLNGYTAEEALGQTPRLVRSDMQGEGTYREMWGTLHSGHTWRGEVVNRRKDGSTYDASLVITPVVSDANRLINIVGVQYDISTLKELDRLKTQFVSDVSHELRTPLTNIRLYLDLMGQTHDADKSASYLQTLLRESERLAHLIDDLLDLSRLEAGATPFSPRPVDLNQLLQALVNDRMALAAKRSLTLGIEVDPEMPPAMGDERLLAQVFTNLLTNAMNYTPAGGQIQLRTKRQAGPDGDWVTAEVRDTGPGIPPEEQTLLFRRFFRGRASHASGASGTGLGLAICKEIAELHGGRVSLESRGRAGEGATFTVWIPAVRPPA